MDAMQVSQCFEDDSCTLCGTLESSLPSTWTLVQCHDTRPSTYMTISVHPPIGSRKIFEKLYLCGVEIIGRKYYLLKSFALDHRVIGLRNLKYRIK